MKKNVINYNLPVSILKEGDAFVAFSPVIDLSSVGDTFEEAQTRFTEAVNLFFEELMEKGTFEEVLLDLGWQKIDNQITPPIVISNQMTSFPVSKTTPLYA